MFLLNKLHLPLKLGYFAIYRKCSHTSHFMAILGQSPVNGARDVTCRSCASRVLVPAREPRGACVPPLQQRAQQQEPPKPPPPRWGRRERSERRPSAAAQGGEILQPSRTQRAETFEAGNKKRGTAFLERWPTVLLNWRTGFGRQTWQLLLVSCWRYPAVLVAASAVCAAETNRGPVWLRQAT